MNTQAQLISFIKNATSPFHVVDECASRLLEAGFTPLSMDEKWSLEKGGAYFTKAHGSSLFSFRIGAMLPPDFTFRIASCHTDSPCLHIKPKAEYEEKGYLRLNVETYGGLIKNTWLDRPLSIAGKAALKSGDIFHPKIRLLNFKRPLITIPNLAIHMNREVNKGIELNSQTEMPPIIGMLNETLNKDRYFINLLAKELDIPAGDILDFDLYVYNAEEGLVLGLEDDFISAPRLDNLTSVYSLLQAMKAEGNPSTISIAAFFDNEEIGSQTKQGADSSIANILLDKIYRGLFHSDDGLEEAILRSLMISVDVAHALHPNYTAKHDPTCDILLNKGVCIKMNSSQKYATDSEAIGAIMQLCASCGIPFQKYVNRSDISGGGTLGSLSSSWLPMKTVDLGIPLLAMHSARELMGARDQEALNRLTAAFYQS